MININQATKDNIIDQLWAKPWEADRGRAYTNDYLHGMRNIEFLEKAANAANDSTNAANITLDPIFDKTLSLPWKTTAAAERFMTWGIEWTKEVTGEVVNSMWVPIPIGINTFAKDEDKKWWYNEHDFNKGKTRYPKRPWVVR